MPRLILMRHAKSDWAPGGSDHDRPLNARGIRSARALGDWLRGRGIIPDSALVSTARRTRETWGLLGFDTAARFVGALYDAESGDLMEALRSAQGDTVLLLGHNPAICAAAHDLVATRPAHARFDDYPTGATLIADFDAPWNAIEPGTGRARDFVVPRELPGAAS
jgi:phosphohistidine phosphatase